MAQKTVESLHSDPLYQVEGRIVWQPTGRQYEVHVTNSTGWEYVTSFNSIDDAREFGAICIQRRLAGLQANGALPE